MKKRFLAFLLSVVLCLSLFTVAAFADDPQWATVTISGTTITVVNGKTGSNYMLMLYNDSNKLLGYATVNVGADGTGTATTNVEGATKVGHTIPYQEGTGQSYTVTFAGGGGTGNAPSMSGSAYLAGTELTLPANTFTRTGYTFAGWSDGSATYAAGATYTMPARNVTFTAQWEKVNNNDNDYDYDYDYDYTPGNTTVKTSSTTNGSFTVSSSTAKAGSTVTITPKPDKGYEVGKVTVTDSKGNAVEVTKNKDGTYSFVMPANTPVTVSVTFVRTNPFTDVAAGEYYYDAVLWGVSEGIVAGMTTTTFEPGTVCTRAQIVTFLWRAAGEPVVNGTNPFTDVHPGDYYYDAVLWGVENGVVAGTTETTFSPDDPCTRAQAVSFLWRADGKPAASGSSKFTDLEPNAYYLDAVQWGAGRGVVAGMTTTTFEPGTQCTRGQIITFLYRDRVLYA